MPERSTTPSTNGPPSPPRAKPARSVPPAGSGCTPSAASTAAPAGSATRDPLTLSVRLTPQALALLEALTGFGLHGWTREEAAARLIEDGLRRAIAEGWLSRR
jgi:hypothetical protein